LIFNATGSSPLGYATHPLAFDTDGDGSYAVEGNGSTDAAPLLS